LNEFAKQVAQEMKKPVWKVNIAVALFATNAEEAASKTREVQAALFRAPYVIETTAEAPTPEAEPPHGEEETP
jgi:hypothetical protein